MIILDLPFPPSINHYYGVMRSGRRFIKAPGIAFRKHVCELVAERRIKTLTGRVSVCISAYMPDKRRRDLDNLSKATNDAMTHAGIWIDDCQVDDFRIIRREVIKGGKLSVVISEINNANNL